MHPQQPWIPRLIEEQVQRDMVQRMRLQQARAAARQNRPGWIANARHSFGAALIAIGGWIQPAERSISEHDASIDLELAR